METPYKFEDAANHRIVTNTIDVNGKVMGMSGFFYLAFMQHYVRKVFRVNNDPLRFGLFAALAVPASYGYAKFFFDSAENEAAVQNNAAE